MVRILTKFFRWNTLNLRIFFNERKVVFEVGFDDLGESHPNRTKCDSLFKMLEILSNKFFSRN